MAQFLIVAFIVIVCLTVIAIVKNARRLKRENLIDNFEFPASIAQKVNDKYPHLDSAEVDMVMDGLRGYFHICNIAGRKRVSMPSQVVDVAWHEFILFTRLYQNFCSRSFGRFLHHTPAEAMKSATEAQKGIKTAWRIACFRENIQPKSPHKLPLLFALDAKLNIPDGFNYALDCSKAGRHPYCGSHISCGSGCAGSCSGDNSGCSSGCGGGD